MATQVQIEVASPLSTSAIPSLWSNFSWTLAGNVVYSGCQWGMIALLAKLGSTALVGRFALGLAITAPVFMFTNLQLRAVQATDARSEFAFADYFTLRSLASLTALSVICLIVLTSRYDLATRAIIVLVGVSKAIESLGDAIAGLLQKAERLNRVSISLMLRGVFSLSAFAAAFWLCRSLIIAVAALLVVWLSVFVLYDLRQARGLIHNCDKFFAFRWPRLKTLAFLSAPLGIIMTLVSLDVNIPRYILVHVLGQAELGIFASLAYLLVAVSLVINALGQSASARLALMYAAGDSRRFRNVLAKLLAFGALVLLVGVPAAKLVGQPLLTFLYRPEYGQHVSLFVIMVAVAGVSSIASFMGYGITAARAFRMPVPVMVVATLTTAICSLVMIPRWGINGAAYAILLGACVRVAGYAGVLRWVLRAIPRHG